MSEENTTNTNEEIDLDHLYDDVFEQQATTAQPADAPAGQEAQAKGRDTGAGKAAEEPAEDPEKRSRNAERRVRREQRIADEAYKRAWDEASSVIADIGGIEDEAGNTIANMNALKKLAEDRRKERMRRGNPTESDIRRIAAEVMKPPADENAEVQRQLDMIRDMDPEMKDLGTILDSDIGADFRAAVENGKTFIQAYGQAIRLKAAKEKGAAESAVARAAGKQHLTSTNQRGTGALEVPAAEMAMYKEINPDASEEEIRKHYNANRKRSG